MKPNFIVRTTLDKPACKALARHQMRKLKFYFCATDIVFIVLVALLWRSGSAFMGLAAMALILLLAYTLFCDQLAGAMIYRSANLSAGETEYAFGEDAVAVTNKAKTSRFLYKSFLSVHETEAHCFLYIQKNVAIVLPKADVAVGDRAQLGTFIAGKIGQPLLRCRS